MTTSYAALTLTAVMMHQVVKLPGEKGFETVLTDEPVSMSATNMAFLTNRFIKAMSNRALPAIEDVAVASSTPGKVREYWGGSSSLPEMSKQLADDLKSVQPGQAPSGLLVVAESRLGSDEALLVAKVEHQAAMRLEAKTNDAGHRVFLIEQLKDLVFADAAKIYKIAILSRGASATSGLAGEVLDDQNGNRFARYFLGRYMGMKLREEPAVLTESFLERFTLAINESTLSPESRVQVQAALLSELTSNKKQIDPQGFIRDHIPSGHQSEIAALAEHRKAPMVAFPKDVQRIESQIHRLRLDFSNGIHLLAPADLVGEGKAVQVRPQEDGTDEVLISGGTLRGVKGTGSR